MEVRCGLWGLCGGCHYDGTDYKKELLAKEQEVIKLFTAPGPFGTAPLAPDFFESPAYEGILPAPRSEGYRNKMEFSFGNSEKDGPLTLGLHQKKSFFNILSAENCRIAPADFGVIIQAVTKFCQERKLSFYHKKSHQGLLRHLVLRRSESNGELLVNLVTASGFAEQAAFTKMLLALPLEGAIAGILHTVNDSLSDAVVPEQVHLLWGRDSLQEEVLGLRFTISPFSFFQTNTRGAELLYAKVREYIAVTPDSLVYDLYSGTGTIAQILAGVAGKVYGVELIPEAVEAARAGAAENGLDNCTFIAGDVLKKLEELPPAPDYIILDPPRDGVHPKALGRLASSGAKRIVYVACKPASLARDLPAFQLAGYQVEKMALVDLFPRTHHCECVALLQKPSSISKEDNYF